MPDSRKIVFTFITVVIVPVLFFVLIELALLVFGVGKSFEYFRDIDINGEAHYQENPDFADQFYPASLNIGPLENTFAKQRDPNTLRVYILGGSAAQGFPYKNHGFDRLLAAQLRAALPTHKIEVINTAMTSVNSHVVYAVADSIPANSADFAVVLMGNNEVVGPYGPGTFKQNFLGSITTIRGLQALKRTRIWQALSGLVSKTQATDAKQELEWQGMQMFTNFGVPYDDPRMPGVYSHYEDNLVDIIDKLNDKNIQVVLSSVPVNLRHSAPFLSTHDPDLSDTQLEQWQIYNDQASQYFNNQNWADAVTSFRAALQIDPNYADTHFRLATAYENLGEFDSAGTHYEQALNLDALRFRADTQINQIIHEVAARAEADSLTFVDSAQAFEKASAPYQPGWNLLLEHVHYDFSGNHILATEIARSIVSNVIGDNAFNTMPRPMVASLVGFPNYDTVEEIKNLQGMIQQPPFPGQSNYAELKALLEDKADSIASGLGSQATVIQRRQDAIASGFADWKLHFELAVLNQRRRNPTAMYQHLNTILELYPHNRETYMKLADARSREGRWRDVIPYLQQSLFYTRGDEEKIAETVNWLGTAYLRTGDYEKAKDQLLEIPDNYPDQIDLSIKAYANLIRYAREQAKTDDLEAYIDDVQQYAHTLIRRGKDEDYPLLYERMSQIMRMGGYDAEAKEWADASNR